MCRLFIITVVSLVLFLLAGCSSTEPAAVQSMAIEPSVAPPAEDCDCTKSSVRLNYVYLTVDAETLDAINESAFIRDHFALFGHSSAEPFASDTAPATYLLGRSTCIELTVASKAQAYAEGNAGICFSTREEGQINSIYGQLRSKLGPNVQRGYSAFNTGAERVPWLRYVSSHSPWQSPALLTWVTEHDPIFHRAVGPNSKCRITESAMASHAEDGEKLFRDITAVTLDLTQSEFDHLAAELSAYGCSKKERKGLTVFSSPDMEIRAAVASDPKYRIRSIRCSLSGALESPAYMMFGDKASLTFTADGTAIWKFGPHERHFARK